MTAKIAETPSFALERIGGSLQHFFKPFS